MNVVCSRRAYSLAGNGSGTHWDCYRDRLVHNGAATETYWCTMGLLQRHTGTQWGCYGDILVHNGAATETGRYTMGLLQRHIGTVLYIETGSSTQRDDAQWGCYIETGTPWDWYIERLVHHGAGT